MELVVTLFTSVAGAAAPAAGATAAAGAAGAAGAAVGGSSALSILQGIGTAFGALATIGSGLSQQQILNAQAEEERMKARDEYIAGVEQSAKLKRELARTLSEQRVQFAMGGVDLGSVSVKTARSEAVKDAERELGLVSNDALRAAEARKRTAANLEIQGQNAAAGGLFGAAGQIAQFGAGLYARG